MTNFNGIINFSGVKYDPVYSTKNMGDVAVSVAVEFVNENTVAAKVSLIGLTVDPQSDIETNEDGSVTIYGGFQNEGGGE